VKIEAAREYIFRTISQLTLNYRGMDLARGHAGPLHGGDRLPWVRLDAGDNYEALSRIGWQVHIYGVARNELKQWCEDVGVPLQMYRWRDTMRGLGLRENALYLIRPDTYVAVADPDQDVVKVRTFLAEVGIRP
jgi:hypothetical protein